MNKKEFIQMFVEQTNLEEDQCNIINDVLERNFIMSKKSMPAIIDDISSRLGISEAEAEQVYDIAKNIINGEIQDKLKHPFKSLD